MLKKVVAAGVVGWIALTLWIFVSNGILGLRSRTDLRRIPDETRVYEVLRESIVEPGGYIDLLDEFECLRAELRFLRNHREDEHAPTLRRMVTNSRFRRRTVGLHPIAPVRSIRLLFSRTRRQVRTRCSEESRISGGS